MKWFSIIGRSPIYPALKQSKAYGIEVELENMGNVREHLAVMVGDKTLWNITEDGSLRNGGAEFVSIPLLGIDQVAPSCQLLDNFASSMWRPDPSGRCGIHVHVNISHLEPEEIVKFLLVSMLFEPVIFEKTGARSESRFCVPSSVSGAISNLLPVVNKYVMTRNELTLAEGLTQLSRLLAGNSKYSAINLMPMRDRLTIEFRHSKSVFPTAEYIPSFVSMLDNALEFALETPLPELLRSLVDLSNDSDYERYSREVFGIHTIMDVDFNNINVRLRDNLRKYKAAISFKAIGLK